MKKSRNADSSPVGGGKKVLDLDQFKKQLKDCNVVESVDELVKLCSSFRTNVEQIIKMKETVASNKKNSPRASSKSAGKQLSPEELQLKKKYASSAMMQLQLKKLNREVFDRSDELISIIESAKKKTEVNHLNLQNLLYQKKHLLYEIKRCREFTTDETDKIDLIDLKEFEKVAPEHLNPTNAGGDAHRLLLNRLSHEKILRQNLKEDKEKRLLEMQKIQIETNKKRKFLSGIPDRLNEIEAATLPLQKYMKASTSARLKRHQEASKLPKPLYVLYCELESYGDIYKNVTVSTNDANAELDTLNKKRQSKKNDKKRVRVERETSDGTDAMDVSTTAATAESAVVDVYLASPLYIKARIRKPGNESISRVDLFILFKYLPHLDIVTVEADSVFNGLLANLFPNDTGKNLPRTLPSREVSKVFPKNMPGRPYKWAQWLAGLYYLPPSEVEGNEVAAHKPCTVDVVEAILTRVRAQQALSMQLDALSKCPHPVPVHKHVASLFPPSAVTKLIKWDELKPSEAEQIIADNSPTKTTAPIINMKKKTTDSSWTKFGRRCFTGVFEMNNKRRIQTIVQVFSDYPARAPYFQLLLCAETATEEEDNRVVIDNNLQSIQVECNAYASELSSSLDVDKEDLSHATFHLLQHQLRRLQMCLDVWSGDANATRMFGRPRRGRDRRLAFVYDAETGQFLHR